MSILEARPISLVHSIPPPSRLLIDSSISVLLYQLTTPNYSTLNNFLLILPSSCLICGILILCTKLFILERRNPIFKGMFKLDQYTWHTQKYHFCCFRLRIVRVAPPIFQSRIVSSTERGPEKRPNKPWLMELKLFALFRLCRQNKKHSSDNQSRIFIWKFQVCPNELDVLEQTSAIEKNT